MNTKMTPAQYAEHLRGIRNGTINPAQLAAMAARAPQRQHNPVANWLQQLRAAFVKASQGLTPAERRHVQPRGWAVEQLNPYWLGETDHIMAALTQRDPCEHDWAVVCDDGHSTWDDEPETHLECLDCGAVRPS
jgi:hypothetical protein